MPHEEILKSLGAAEYALNAAIKFNKPIELLPLITTFVVDDSTFAAQVAASTLPQKAIESLFRTNSTTDISNILTFLSSICCEKIVAKNIWGVPGFADYLTAIISTGSSSSVVGPALGIIGNFLSVCELNERNLFLKSDLIEGVLRLVQCGGKLVKDAVWVLGNIIAVAPVNIVKTIVECGTIPLLMRLVDEEKRNKKLIWELFVALTNILVKGEGNTYPFVESCIRLGFVEIAMDFVSECVQLTELIADAFYFLADHHIGFSKKLVEINALPLLQQTNNSRVQMLLEKLRYV
ncbi:Importin subunit alpha-1 [Entamoeba marina]